MIPISRVAPRTGQLSWLKGRRLECQSGQWKSVDDANRRFRHHAQESKGDDGHDTAKNPPAHAAGL
jgi:hypothetical protein